MTILKSSVCLRNKFLKQNLDCSKCLDPVLVATMLDRQLYFRYQGWFSVVRPTYSNFVDP